MHSRSPIVSLVDRWEDHHIRCLSGGRTLEGPIWPRNAHTSQCDHDEIEAEWVIVPALKTGVPDRLLPALERPDVKQAKAQLLKWHAGGACIAASCIGTFLLAETGLLDHREATTTWWLAPLFRQRYPKVLLDESRMLVSAGTVVTTGAAMGHLDLALWLIRTASPELSTLVSRYLLADIRSLQATYIIPNHLAQADPLILRLERWARENLEK